MFRAQCSHSTCRAASNFRRLARPVRSSWKAWRSSCYRWAAMNPPSPDDPDDDDSGGSVYLGSEPLDPALADRFAFLLRVPGWAELTKAERRSVALAGAAPASDLDLPALVARCRERAAALRPVLAERIADYVVTVVDQLRAAKIQLSPRRSALLVFRHPKQ